MHTCAQQASCANDGGSRSGEAAAEVFIEDADGESPKDVTEQL